MQELRIESGELRNNNLKLRVENGELRNKRLNDFSIFNSQLSTP